MNMQWTSAALVFCVTSCAAARGAEPAAAKAPSPKLLAKPDAHKTLVNPNCSHCVDESKRRSKDLKDDDRCLAWIRGKYDGGAIPVRFFLNPYRVISDTYGVFVYDPDAGYLRGFEPSLDFTFHGWRGGVMVMKHKDGTLFSCLSGRAFEGPRKGEKLKPVATIPTKWGPWLAAYPNTVAYHMFDKYQPIDLPSKASADAASTRGPVDPRLPAQTKVLGVVVGNKTRAYPIHLLEESAAGLITDEVDGRKIVVLWHQPTQCAAAYAAKLDDGKGAEVTLQRDSAPSSDEQPSWAQYVDTTSGSHFDVAGRAVDGKLKGKTLEWIDSVECRWFAWSAEYPDTTVASLKTAAETDDAVADEPRPAKSIAARPVALADAAKAPLQGIIMSAADASADRMKKWTDAGYGAAVIVLDEATNAAGYRAAADAVKGAGLDLFYWIEVGRNKKLADEHPEWVATMGGVHDDWIKRYPKATPPDPDTQVAKAYPWVPIGYQEAFNAHLARIKKLLAERAAGNYKGLLLNDLQGGPAACGCGNLLCRWAIDYSIPSTATKLPGDDVAARFLVEAAKLAPGKQIVPIWVTECDDTDLPARLRADGKTTGLCGSVACARGMCPKKFSLQWTALVKSHKGPIGVLALHRELERVAKDAPEPTAWINQSLAYLDQVPRQQKGRAVSRDRLWVVVQGYGVPAAEQAAAVKAAKESGASAVLTAVVRIDQSYEPRNFTLKGPIVDAGPER